MPISHEHKTIFVHIPKTGGTSMESALNIRGEWPQWDENIVYGLWKGGHKKKPAQHFSMAELIDYGFVTRTMQEEYFSFCFVRNPWERAVSNFAWMLRKGHISPLYWLSHISPQKQKQYFVRFLKKSRHQLELQKGKFLHHFLPQTSYFLDEHGNSLVNFVGRFETIAEDFATVQRHIGLESKPLPHQQKSTHKQYREYYNDEAKHIVEELYHQEIQLLGYTF